MVMGDLLILLDVPLVLLFVGGVLEILVFGEFVFSDVTFLEELRPLTALVSFDVDRFLLCLAGDAKRWENKV